MSLSIMYDSGRNNARSSVYREAKMMSYTFAEMIDEEAATAAPRCYPHSILGKGKRVRRVTVTQAVRKNLCER